PVGFTDDPFEALALQDELQTKYTGGTVLHLYMAEQISSAQDCKNLVRKALGRFRLPYLTVTPTCSICPVHGYLAGEHEFCPKCDEAPLSEHQYEKSTRRDRVGARGAPSPCSRTNDAPDRRWSPLSRVGTCSGTLGVPTTW